MAAPDSTEASERQSRPAQHHVEPSLLGAAAAGELLDYAIENEKRFAPSALHYGGGYSVNTAVRSSLRLADFEPKAGKFWETVMPLVPRLAAQLGMRAPVVGKVELELVAHGDGAFFARHFDNGWDPETRTHRVLSGTYYFHTMPKGFAGGGLRLFPSGAAPVEIQPIHDSFVVFQPWLAHEVAPVRCLSRRFADSRFSINIWLSAAEPQLQPIASPG